ncbi:hypothetical protein T440DRAFT_116580 [Plenodomus tracheiphilus IPT5]|uniref:Uncharacterized protein n=1 Tax=Plenodomus tracheiphilus IPT5 TaxID=1408161 RepID=A0A6A7B4P7_9PLEO|nr:hypothetical protein T440DRAFT_116580 [Plenodomus tracheiphilus IPT5]
MSTPTLSNLTTYSLLAACIAPDTEASATFTPTEESNGCTFPPPQLLASPLQRNCYLSALDKVAISPYETQHTKHAIWRGRVLNM